MTATICEQVIEEQWSHISFERETRLISLVLGR
jgi:hypothetical protein